MAEDGPATSGTGRRLTWASYMHNWNRFVAWSEADGRRFLPATTDDVAAYPEDGANSGGKASTIKVVAAALSHNQKEAGFDLPFRHGVARDVLEELNQDDSPGPTRALSLNLDCYLAIMQTACELRSGRGGRMERASNARRRGTLDVAMIGLMRDARLRVSEATADTMRLLSVVPRRLRAGPEHETQTDSDTYRRGDEAGWVGRNVLAGQSPIGDDQRPGDSRGALAGRPRRRQRTVVGPPRSRNIHGV